MTSVVRNQNILITFLYSAMLTWLYFVEIVPFWSYMGFTGEPNNLRILVAMTVCLLLGAILPIKPSTRTYLLIILHYMFLVPSIIYAAYSTLNISYVASIVILISSLYTFSQIPIKTVATIRIKHVDFATIIFFFIAAAITLQAMFGGLNNFNLDLEAVYNFRKEAAEEIPGIFGYIFSNVSNVLVPISVILAITFKSRVMFLFAAAMAIVLFGMTHHKSVFFTPILVASIYFVIARLRTPSLLGMLFLAMVGFAVIEVVYLRSFAGSSDPGFYTSYTIRRTLLVPPMLDAAYVNFFSEHPKYFWSTSRFGLGLIDAPSDVAAPFLIGREVFLDSDMSANTGVIGSGYSNASMFGVILYSVLAGFLIAVLEAFGRRLSHPLVAAAGTMTLLNIVTTTDFTTAILSHGLLLLLIVLSYFPPLQQFETQQKLGHA